MMSLNTENSTFKSDASAAHHASETKATHTSRLLDDCDLSSPANRLAKIQVASVNGGSEDSRSFTGTVNSDAKSAQGSGVRDQLGTEQEFMTYAPNQYRHQLGLPANASSKDFIDKYIDKEVDNFELANKQQQNFTLKNVGIDAKTSRDILEHQPGSEKSLAKILLQKEKEYLQIPAQLKGEESYKKMETGILHDNYQALVGLESLMRAMKSP